jgi:hypothetical protein
MMAISTPRVTAPHIFDLGKLRGRRVRELKNGSGRRLDRHIELATRTASDDYKQRLSENPAAHIVPVVVVIRKKVKKTRKFGFG